MRDIVHLPHDLFLLVLSHLPPSTCVLCRAVSRQWHAAFTDPDTCLRLLRWNFPRCREMRLLGHDTNTTPPSWPTTFADVARRYHHLLLARPRLIENLPTAGPDDGLSFRGVATWNRFLRRDDKTSNFHHPDPVWSYSRHDALLVYPRPSSRSPPGQLYHIYDPPTAHHVPVPFDVRGKHVRRVRLAHGVLIFEWAEAHPYHQLNDREFVHRHFVTAFRVTGEGEGVTFLSEWKLHFLGLPLNRSDRFFSVHNSSHYAAYLWQPNRSLYNDDPIEQLAVWDLSSPSPSPIPTPVPAPPAGTGLWTAPNPPSPPPSASPPTKEPEEAPQPSEPATAPQPDKPEAAPPAQEAVKVPPVIHRLSWRQLAFYRLRQRTNPQLRELRLDAHNLYLVEEEHYLADGQHSSLAMPVGHVVRCTGVPIIPFPCSSSDSGVGEWEWGPGAEAGGAGGVVYGPVWACECAGPGSGDGNGSGSGGCRRGGEEGRQEDEEERFAPCWRHAAFPELTVARVVDREAGVVVEGRVGVGEEEGVVEVSVDGRAGAMGGGMGGALMGKGRMEGEERWIFGEGGDGAVTVVRF